MREGCLGIVGFCLDYKIKVEILFGYTIDCAIFYSNSFENKKAIYIE
jgi:hypothetical protein